MFDLSDPLFISAFLNVFMMSMEGCQSRVSVRWSRGVKHSYHQNKFSQRPPHQAFAAMSSQASSWMMAEAPDKDSPVMG